MIGLLPVHSKTGGATRVLVAVQDFDNLSKGGSTLDGVAQFPAKCDQVMDAQ